MLQIMGIGNQGVWGIIARGEVAEKGCDLWHSGTSVVDELNPQGPVITCDSSNGHRHSSLAIRESIPAWIRRGEETRDFHSRQQGRQPPGAEERGRRGVGAGGAQSVWLSPVRNARVSHKCQYNSEHCLCAFRFVGDAVCPPAARHWRSTALSAVARAEGPPLSAADERHHQARPHPTPLG